MEQDRRTFIKVTSLASATLVPLVGTLMQACDKGDKEFSAEFNKTFEFHLIDNNLLNLHFYFINVKKNGSSILSADTNQKSFMIVRLPQMHISESGHWYKNWSNSNERLPSAILSGYSYLAFQLWPDKIIYDKEGKKTQTISNSNKKLKFTLENVLNWNDENNFELITLVEWLDLKKNDTLDFADYKKCADFNEKKVWHLTNENVTNEYKESYYETNVNEPANSFNYKKYKSLVRHFLDKNLKSSANGNNNFIPITFLEFPQGVVLVPVARDESGALAKGDKKPIKQFWENKYVNQKEVVFGYRKYEVWNNTLFYKTKVKTKGEGSGQAFKIETPSFRIAGLITEKDVDCPDLTIKECEDTNTDGGTLPSLLDKTELAFLTQFAEAEQDSNSTYKGIKFKDGKFDIKESNGLFFTGLGIITHLKYYNEDTPTGIDLIEYEHIITEGRDIFIKVARIGIHNKNGKRYKHVIEGKRKVETEIKDPATGQVSYAFPSGTTSFIEFKQYCECIEKTKNYEFPENPTATEWDATNFKSPLSITPSLNPIFHPATSNIAHYRRYPWKEIRTIEKKRIPIEPFQDQKDGKPISNPECALWFWPVLEGTLQNPKYLQSVFDADDWDNGTLNLATPFIFIRKSVIEEEKTPEITNLTNSYFNISDDPTAPINTRRKITINSQKIAFTKPLPTKDTSSLSGQELSNALNESKNKTHILETDFIETYFDISQKSVFGTKPFAQVRFPLLPQVLRAKVYVDHIRDLTLQKVPSIVEYQKEYIEHGFKDFDDTTKKYANAAKLILANTEAFINEKEESVNNTYGEIKNALQEAKDKLGNLTVPDIIPDSISLEKFGLTLPKDVGKSIAEGRTVFNDTVQKIVSFNPRELLRGKLSDVCGLDLTAVLDELLPADSANNQTPLFEINKIANKITDEIKNSSVFKEIEGDIKAVKNKIEELEKEYTDLAQNINNKENELADNLKKLSNYIPNSDELDNLIKNKFEQLRTEAFTIILSDKEFIKIKKTIDDSKLNALDFIDKERQILYGDFQNNLNSLKDYFKDCEDKELAELNTLSDDIRKIESSLIKDYVETNLKKLYDDIEAQWDILFDLNNPNSYYSKITNLYATINETPLQIDGQTVYFVVDNNGSKNTLSNISYELTNIGNQANQLLIFGNNDFKNSKYIQLQNKIETLRLCVVKNINGNEFQRKATNAIQVLISQYEDVFKNVENDVKQFQNATLSPISNNITTWKKRTDDFLNNTANIITPEVRNAVIKIQGLVLKLNPYIDFLRRFDPYFFFTTQQQLAKDINDIKNRFQQDFYDLYSVFVTAIEKSYQETFLPFYNDYVTVSIQFNNATTEFREAKKNYEQGIINEATYQIALTKYNEFLAKNIDGYNSKKALFNQKKSEIVDSLKDNAKEVVSNYIKKLKDNSKVRKIYEAIYGDEGQNNGLIEELKIQKQSYRNKLLEYKKYVEEHITSLGDNMVEQISTFIINHPDEVEKVQEAQNLYRLLTSIKQQDLTYSWNTNKFRDVNLGIVSFKKFSNPDTTLKVDVRATTYFTSGKFPPAIDKVVTYSENRFTNFGISFFNCLTVGFNEISFIAGSDHSTHFDVKIKDVKFDGALSFVQAFESWLQTMGKGLILQVYGDHAALGYSLAIPAIKTPGFNFFNLSLNFDLRVYFDKRPLRFGFSLARPDSKFGIAVGIYAGFGFFSIVADPKKGIVEIDTALEAGAWAGISFGPFSGEVKLAFGFRYTKNEFGVRIEGYIVAEGRLSFWIIEVAARIYLGVVSQNSYVEGVCTVTYSVKIGFISKSFSGTFHKKIAGANSNNSERPASELAKMHERLETVYYTDRRKTFLPANRDVNLLSVTELSSVKADTFKRIISEISNYYNVLEKNGDEEELIIEPVEWDEWKDFIETF